MRAKPKVSPLSILGLICLGLPAVCLFILIASTGVRIEPGAETLFYATVFFGLKSGIVSIPLGILLLALAWWLSRRKPN